MQPTLHQLFFRAFHGQNNRLQAVRDELGLGRGQPRILSYLSRHEPCTQREIADYFRTDPASISRMVELLCQNGFVTRIEDSTCRRANRLSLTERGQKAAQRWAKECDRLDSLVLSGFTPQEAGQLKDMLGRILDNLDRRWE